MTAQNSPL